MKKIIIAIVLLVLVAFVAGGTFFYFESNENAELENYANTVQQNSNSATTTISMAEVAKHDQKTDCWMIIDKDVLDVTGFVDKHPGGEVIVQGCGKDATDMFGGVRQHLKPFVKTLAQKMVVGKLEN